MKRASQQALSTPSFRTPADCTPWVLGGLWPTELNAVTTETATMAEYLKRDLQRIADSANEKMRILAESGLHGDERTAEETRVINVARAFAVLRVESTVRQLRKEAIGFQTEYLRLDSVANRGTPAIEQTQIVDMTELREALRDGAQKDARREEPQREPVNGRRRYGRHAAERPAVTVDAEQVQAEEVQVMPAVPVSEPVSEPISVPISEPVSEPVPEPADRSEPRRWWESAPPPPQAPAASLEETEPPEPLETPEAREMPGVPDIPPSDIAQVPEAPEVAEVREAPGAPEAVAEVPPEPAAPAAEPGTPAATEHVPAPPRAAPPTAPGAGGAVGWTGPVTESPTTPPGAGVTGPAPSGTTPAGAEPEPVTAATGHQRQPEPEPEPELEPLPRPEEIPLQWFGGRVEDPPEYVPPPRPAPRDTPAEPVARPVAPVPSTPRRVDTAGADGEPRLARLLEYVARQEPGLRWAIGARADGATVLVTDLAYGWIPPGLDLPADVELLPPARRRGNATALLGQAGDTVSRLVYAPGDPFRGGGEAEAGASSAPRQLPDVDDLGWKLGEATHWRDGLPRMVNTLARAAAAGTGVVEAELDVLRVHLDTARYQLMSLYPDVDPNVLLNCLLLAATEALATGDKVAANYHFSWFEALSAPAGSQWNTY
ncbi:DUF5631 domain-containing protein [Mycolicibacterium palauense]|uniref:DUF5631 domain-containing protein n=1 Tax=Mycolicibacterium palauense TaxID=2034511 RepID=UPI000BFF087D|nr:DUF5631 domain-containing protein [Mycolicibacterium palauense]